LSAIAAFLGVTVWSPLGAAETSMMEMGMGSADSDIAGNLPYIIA
jgi:hypothetical protein